MAELKKCPDCGGELEKGTIGQYNVPHAFIKGEVTDSSAMFPFGRVAIKTMRGITVHRCMSCGRMFLYANRKEWSVRELNNNQWKIVVIVLGLSFLLVMLVALFSM